jgi:CRP/FNR family transcriptional regulator, cyclic AMP receptor protein
MRHYSADARRQLLEKHFLLSQMPRQVLDEIVKFSIVKTYRVHEVIVKKGDPGECLYGILSGRVRIFSSAADGREILLNILEVGELFGEIAVLDGRERTASAAAMNEVDLLSIHRHHLLPYLKNNPELVLTMLSLLCERLRWTSTLVEDSVFLSVPVRLAKRLLILTERYGVADSGRVRIGLQLSQHDLGNMIGATREVVNKHLAAWRSRGIIDVEQGQIVVGDRNILSDLANSE